MTFDCKATNNALQLYLQKTSANNIKVILVSGLALVIYRLATLNTDKE